MARKKLQKLLAAWMAFSMTMSLVSVSALADSDEDGVEAGGTIRSVTSEVNKLAVDYGTPWSQVQKRLPDKLTAVVEVPVEEEQPAEQQAVTLPAEQPEKPVVTEPAEEDPVQEPEQAEEPVKEDAQEEEVQQSEETNEAAAPAGEDQQEEELPEEVQQPQEASEETADSAAAEEKEDSTVELETMTLTLNDAASTRNQQVEVPVNWTCEDYQSTSAGTYECTAVLNTDAYELGEDVEMPSVQVTVSERMENTVVAAIGDVKYNSLNDAVEAVMSGENTGEIDLLLSDELTVNFIREGTTVIINGNGNEVAVPKQKTDNGDLTIQGILTFRNTVVSFETEETRNWSATIGSKGVLNLEQGTECRFTKTGIYTSPDATINVDDSTLTLEDMEYTAMMAEAYGNLNVVNGSEFLLSDAMRINGLTSFNIYVNNSSFTVKDCERQGLTKCGLKLENGATALLENDDIGYNLYGRRVCEVNEGTTLTIRNCGSRALMTQSTGAVDIKAGGKFIVTGNGYRWSKGDEDKYYPEKGAITMAVYGWDENDQQFYTWTTENTTLTFEDGADVQITDNYVRGITNFGKAYIGAGTVICNNGTWDADEGYEACREALGGGVYNANQMEINPKAVLYNNHANTAGDDIYNENGASLTFAAVGEKWTLDGEPDCTHAITGWFDDSEGSRWEAHTAPYHAAEYTPVEKATGELSLKAAHGIHGAYKVVHEYYLNNELQGKVESSLSDEVGKTITVNDVEKLTNYDNAEYTYTSCTPESITVSVDEEGVLTLRYDRTTVTPPTPGGGDTPSGPSDDGHPLDPEPSIPDDDVPKTDLPVDEDVPTTPDIPETPEEPADIPEEDVPMADAPKTGDISAFWAAMAVLSLTGLAAVTFTGKRSKQEN